MFRTAMAEYRVVTPAIGVDSIVEAIWPKARVPRHRQTDLRHREEGSQTTGDMERYLRAMI
jgi:hypothetical protein